MSSFMRALALLLTLTLFAGCKNMSGFIGGSGGGGGGGGGTLSPVKGVFKITGEPVTGWASGHYLSLTAVSDPQSWRVAGNALGSGDTIRLPSGLYHIELSVSVQSTSTNTNANIQPVFYDITHDVNLLEPVVTTPPTIATTFQSVPHSECMQILSGTTDFAIQLIGPDANASISGGFFDQADAGVAAIVLRITRLQ